VSEMALRMTRRLAAAADTPAYQASTTVRSSPKASTATATPKTVSRARSVCRNALRNSSFHSIGQNAFVEVLDDGRPPGGPRSWVTMMTVLPARGSAAP